MYDKGVPAWRSLRDFRPCSYQAGVDRAGGFNRRVEGHVKGQLLAGHYVASSCSYGFRIEEMSVSPLINGSA